MVDDIDLYPHQQKALKKLSNGKILCGGVGTGKSRVAVAYYLQNEAPKDVVVLTTAKKRDAGDWSDEFYNAGIGPKARAGQILGDPANVRKRRHQLDQSSGVGGNAGSNRSGLVCPEEVLSEGHREGCDCGGCRDGAMERHSLGQSFRSIGSGEGNDNTYPYSVTVDSWNQIGKYVDLTGAFVICDEQRLVGTGSWVKAFLRIAKNNTWVLLSGTPGDTWLDFAPLFIANGFYRNITDFKRQHVVYSNFTKFPKIDRYVDVGRLARQRAQLLVEMPYVRHTRRRHVEVPVRYDKDALDLVLTKRWHVFEDRPLRDVGEMFSVARRVVNGDPSRLAMVCELWKIHPKLIVFYGFNYELESLRSLKEYYGNISSSSLTTGSMELGRKHRIDTATKNYTEKKSEHGLGATSNLSGVCECKAGSPHQSEKCTSMTDENFLNAEVLTDTRTAIGVRESTFSDRSTIDLSDSSSKKRTPCLVKDGTVSIAEWNGHKHQPVPSTDRWLYLVQYTAGAEGWNCTETDAMIMYSRNYSWKVSEQAYGRIDRLNTPFTDLWYYDFASDSWIDKAIGRSLKAKENFNESKFKRLFK